MRYIEHLIEQPQTYRLGLSLLHFLWQGAAVAMVVALMTPALRRQSASLRYVVLLAALGLMALLPVATFCLVESPATPKGSVASAEPDRGAAATLGDESSEEATSPEFPLEAVEGAGGPATNPVWEAAVAQAKATLRTAFIDWIGQIQPFLPWVVLGWGMGVLFLSGRLAADWLSVARLVRRQVQPVTESVRQTAERLGESLRLRHAVTLLESASVKVPTVVGFWRPVILLPVSALVGLPPPQLESLLAHELAHIRRYDYLANMLQSAVETLLFYHPAVWWLSDRIRAERENCCDDIAVSVVGNRLLYAQALVDMAKLRNRQRDLAVAASGSDLRRRIQRVLGISADRPGRLVPWWVGAVLLTTLLLGMSTLSADPARRAGQADGKEHSVTTERAWGNGNTRQIGLAAVNGHERSDPLEAAFGSFEVRSPDSAKKSGPVYLERQKLYRERQKLQGTWEVVACRSDEGVLADFPCSWFAVHGSKVTIAKDGESITSEYTVDVGKEPKELTVTGIGGGTVTAVYSVQQDSAVIRMDRLPGALAPTERESHEGEGRLLMTLRRMSAVEAAALERNARPRWEHFSRLDQDRDGRLTMEELLVDYPTPEAARQGTTLFEVLDSDRDHKLTLDEFRANLRKAMFLRMDLNADGALSEREFAHGEMKAAPPAGTRRVFELVDKDDDGLVDFGEFLSRSPEAWLVKLDTSEDGRLSYDEYEAGNGPLVRNNRCRAAFAAIDRDGDGSLSLDELANKPREALFIRRDADADQKLTFEEFLFLRRDPEQVALAKEEFARRDRDGDGLLTLEEYAAPAA